ncbi:unnamed protein product, partial [Nezara viridula]
MDYTDYQPVRRQIHKPPKCGPEPLNTPQSYQCPPPPPHGRGIGNNPEDNSPAVDLRKPTWEKFSLYKRLRTGALRGPRGAAEAAALELLPAAGLQRPPAPGLPPPGAGPPPREVFHRPLQVPPRQHLGLPEIEVSFPQPNSSPSRFLHFCLSVTSSSATLRPTILSATSLHLTQGLSLLLLPSAYLSNAHTTTQADLLQKSISRNLL